MTDNGIREEARRQLRHSNSALRAQVDTMLEGLQAQTEALAAAQGAVARTTAEAESPDGLVRVTVDAAGAVLAARVEPTAFTRTTPDRLAESFSAAARAATADVRAQVADLMAPVAALTASIPDLPDLVPGAPAMRHLVPTVATEFTSSTTSSQVSDPDGDDMHDWRAPIMREAHRD
ncbi:YbaB/EbfC family DNA-binding protein [Prescottella agglutinans]|uniref:YbaB/EbfC family DNA-binding protein n=1 Tax=Prescottella agglutinans TaxID=1644129 RepID=A0A3S3EC76_9NOCA|nr:YbaB/EbfC family nucleoid-associated protein [Prescottella agglutinans]RVW10122.1 YbaB/EbfC family DNA-binding protein [Prescottella agglutinans]